MLQCLSEWWPVVIVGVFFVPNVVLWTYLLAASTKFKQKLSTYLESLVRPLSRQTDSGSDTALMSGRILVADNRGRPQNRDEERSVAGCMFGSQ